MTLVIELLGIAVAALGALGLVRPQRLIGFATSIWNSGAGLPAAVAIRVLLGAALLATASASRFPTPFRVLGALSLVAAVAAPLLGRERLRRFVDWWAGRPATFVRAWALVALGFGAFLVCGVC